MLPFFFLGGAGIEGFELSLVYGKLYHVAAGRWNKFYASCLFLSAGMTKNEGPRIQTLLYPNPKTFWVTPTPAPANEIQWHKYSFSETARL